jgi:MFS transporter, ACS family, tartrate transporter
VEAPVTDTEAAFQAGAALAVVYFCILTPFYGLSFFLSRIVKDFGVTNVQAGFVTAIPYLIGAIGMVHWGLP